MSRYIIYFGLFLLCACQSKTNIANIATPENIIFTTQDTIDIETYGLGKAKLSEYNFFIGDLSELLPNKNVFPYELNASLFSDYAFKERFIFLPEKSVISYQSDTDLIYPIGTVLIKNFYYPEDFTKPKGKRTIIETRLLIKKEDEWNPLSYVWNDQQTEAYFWLVGKDIPVKWYHYNGEKKEIVYTVPDVNQCKNCHMENGKTRYIGTSIAQLNKDLHNGVEQLSSFRAYISDIPDLSKITRIVDYHNTTFSIADRARSYLHVNCGSCHRDNGSAKTSGLNLIVDEDDPYKLGFNKPPVAAGRASGGRLYDIVAGKPEESILLFRMESTDGEIMMPEIGRKLAHYEGINLIKDWISSF